MSGAKLRALGWRPAIPLQEGLASAYAAFMAEAARSGPVG
jgi:nucleoside-diphosphate-sugar epimerase